MTTTSMMMAINDAIQEVPPEYGNDGAEWGAVFILLFVVPIISFIISFIILYKLTQNKTRSLIGTIIGSVVAFILGLGIPLPIEGRSPFLIFLSTKIPENIFFPTVLIYCVVISIVIGLLTTPSRYFEKEAKDNETKI
jgi:hypothetical protein